MHPATQFLITSGDPSEDSKDSQPKQVEMLGCVCHLHQHFDRVQRVLHELADKAQGHSSLES